MATSPAQLLARAHRFLVDELWSADFGPKTWASAALGWLQLGALIARGFVDEKLLLRASALTYISSLAIIPVLVVLLSVMDWLGLSRGLVKRVVDQFLAGNPDALDRIMGVVDAANIGAFGSVGGGIFLVTTLLSLRHVEETFNEIWGAIQPRGWVRRFTNYLAVLVTVPLVLGTLWSILPGLEPEALAGVPEVEALKDLLTGVGPLMFLFVSFTLTYFLLPNTPVRVLSAAMGGGVAALLFSGAQWGYVSFSVGVARYDSLFGGFAIVPLLLVWIYVSWSIVLLGCLIAYAHQNLARYRREARDAEMAPAEREAMGLRLMVELGRAFRDGWQPQSAGGLSERLGASLRTVTGLLVAFEEVGLVTICGAGDGDERYQLGRAAEAIRLDEVMLALRGRPRDRSGASDADPSTRDAVREVDALLRDVQRALSEPLGKSLAGLVARLPEQAAPDLSP